MGNEQSQGCSRIGDYTRGSPPNAPLDRLACAADLAPKADTLADPEC